MSNEITIRQNLAGQFVADVLRHCEVFYTTDPQASEDDARRTAASWNEWFEGVPHGRVESIYYILVVPETWAGPPPGAHPYSGLHFKIGRTNNVLKRVANLQTGTSGELIVHALEPGSANVESLRHARFASERRQGEWFASSPQLCRHVFDTWRRNNALPPDHQAKLARLVERIETYRLMRQAIEGAPDMVNPSLDEPWRGKVFIDLVYTKLLGNDG